MFSKGLKTTSHALNFIAEGVQLEGLGMKRKRSIEVLLHKKRKLPEVLGESRKRVSEGISKGSLRELIKSSKCGDISGNV